MRWCGENPVTTRVQKQSVGRRFADFYVRAIVAVLILAHHHDEHPVGVMAMPPLPTPFLASATRPAMRSFSAAAGALSSAIISRSAVIASRACGGASLAGFVGPGATTRAFE